MLKKLFYLLAIALVFTACAIDLPTDDNGGGKVGFSVHATRANNGEYVPENDDCELIKTYRIVITKPGDNTIIRCIDKTLDNAVELDPVDEIQLSSGTYNVYAFANIDFDYLADLGIKEGGSIPSDITGKKYKVPNYFNAENTGTKDEKKYEGQLVSTKDFTAAGHYIPMTSIAPQVVEVTSRVNQTFNIEVRRLFAKIEFVFSNGTEDNLQLNALSIGNMTFNAAEGGTIPLMNLEEGRDMLPDLNMTEPATLSYDFETPLRIIPEDDDDSNDETSGEKVSHSFYVLESHSQAITNSFPLLFKVTPGGQSLDKSEDLRLTLTNPNVITLIHRNDWIVIPVTLIDWQMKLEVLHYPPIGGYPQTYITENDNKDFVVSFNGPGDFVIAPFVRRYFEGAVWSPISNRDIVVSDPTIEIDDADYFTKAPQFTKSGEIIGKMKSKPGITCTVTISVDVKYQLKNGTEQIQTLKRKIYITQKEVDPAL